MKKIIIGSLLFAGMMLNTISAQTDSSLGREVSRVAVGIDQDALIDQFGNPITKVDATRESFGEDSHGKYWHWDSDSFRGGGFYIDLERPLREEYTISMKFSYSDVNGSWKKILDYKNRGHDDGFYFADNGHLIFYRGENRGDKRQQFKNDEVLDLIVTRFADGRFVVYSVKNGQLEKELEVMLGINDTTFQEVNGKTRLGFFFDDNVTSSEATRSGKFYSARVWEKAIDDEVIRDKLDEITKIEPPADDAKTYNPTGEDKTVDKGSPLTPEDIITNENDLPPNTTFTFKDNPDTTTPGTRPVTVVVTYPDNSSEEVTVNITIPSDADKFSPVGKDKTIFRNDSVNPGDMVADSEALPQETTFAWKSEPDVSVAGVFPVNILVNYPDNSQDEVTANLTILSDAEHFAPTGEDKTVDKGSPLAPEDVITNENDLPPNTTFTFKDNPDTTTPGTRPVTVVVTYPDNSSEEVTVNITVRSDADKFSPVGKDKTIQQNDPVKSTDLIQNPDSLPPGTDFTFKDNPDTSVVGSIPVTIIVTYSDGSTEEITATLTVNPKNSPTTPGNTNGSSTIPSNPSTSSPSGNGGGGFGGSTGGNNGGGNPIWNISIPNIPSSTKTDENSESPKTSTVESKDKNDNSQNIFTLKNRITPYICEQFVQAYKENELLVRDVAKNNRFREDISALTMFRGLEKDEMNLGQTYEEYQKHGVVLNVTNFEPNRNVTRAEFVKMLVRSLSCRYTYMGTDTGFSDVEENMWYAEYIKFAVENGWINGYKDGTFRPNNSITRDEAAKILARAIKLQTQGQSSTSFQDVEHTSEFIPYIETLKDKGVMKGRTTETFAPKSPIPRTETSRIIYRTFFGGKL